MKIISNYYKKLDLIKLKLRIIIDIVEIII